MFRKLMQILFGIPRVSTTTFPGPDTIYYHTYKNGEVRYFDTFEAMIKFHEDRKEPT